MSAVEAKSEMPKRQRLTSCTDESNIVHYFEMVHPAWYVFTTFLHLYIAMLAYAPKLIPYDNFGIIGEYSRTLTNEYEIVCFICFWGIWTIHLLEAIYVVNTAYQFYINPKCLNLWFFQTLYIGYPSTNLMKSYANKRYKSQ